MYISAFIINTNTVNVTKNYDSAVEFVGARH